MVAESEAWTEVLPNMNTDHDSELVPSNWPQYTYLRFILMIYTHLREILPQESCMHLFLLHPISNLLKLLDVTIVTMLSDM
jgi:hypothetical protein